MVHSKPKLLVTASTFPRVQGNTDPRFVYDMAMHMSKHFDISVLAPATPGIPLSQKMESDVGELDVIRYRYAPFRFVETLTNNGAIIPSIHEKPIRALLVPFMLIGLFFAVRKQLKLKHYDCVHAHWYIPQGAIQSFFSGTKHPPFVVTGLGGDVWGLNNKLCAYLKRRTLKKAAAATALSEEMGEKLRIYYRDAEIHIARLGCDTSKFSPKKRVNDYYVTHHGLKGIIILFVGRLAEKKGVEYLIRAMNHERIRPTDAKLVIVGDGPLRNDLESLTNRLKVCDKVKFLGAVNHDMLGEIEASADIFCSPSIVAQNGDREGFLVANIEASASGLPIVTTTTTMSCQHNHTGIIIDEKDIEQLANALLSLISNSGERRRLGANGVEWARQLNWDSVAESYVRIIRESMK